MQYPAAVSDHNEFCILHFPHDNCILRVAFRGESQLRQSRAIQPMVHAGCGCFSVFIIHRTLTRTTGSLTCAKILMHAVAPDRYTDTVRQYALKLDSGRKVPCRTGESNLRQRRAGPTLYELSYIPTHGLVNWVAQFCQRLG